MKTTSSLPLCSQLDSKSQQPLLVPRETTCAVTAVVTMPTAEQAVSDGPASAPDPGPAAGGWHRPSHTLSSGTAVVWRGEAGEDAGPRTP